MAKSTLTKYEERGMSVQADIDALRTRIQNMDQAPALTEWRPSAPPESILPTETAFVPSPLSVLDLVHMLREGWWIIALTTLAGLAMALLSIYIAVPQYKATAQLILSQSAELSGPNAIYGATQLEKRTIVSTFAELLDSDRIYNETSAMLQIEPEVLEQYTRSTVVLPETTILEHSVIGPDPQLAALLANSAGQRTIEYAKGLYQEAYEVNFLNLAAVPLVPDSPKPLQNISLALGLGLVLGIGLAIARGLLVSDKRFGLPWQAEAATDLSGLDPRQAMARLQSAIERHPSTPISLALIRLDSTPGRLAELPRPFVQKLQEQGALVLRHELRGKDVVIPWEETGIAILLPDVPGRKAQRALEQMRHLLADALEFSQNGEVVRLDPRVGLAERTNQENARVLVEQAQQALEAAQRNGTTTELYALGAQMAWSE